MGQRPEETPQLRRYTHGLQSRTLTHQVLTRWESKMEQMLWLTVRQFSYKTKHTFHVIQQITLLDIYRNETKP